MAKITVNRKGIRSLLSSPEVANDLARRAHRIAQAAGPGNRVEVEPGSPEGHRARAAVITDTSEAVHAEATRRALTSAVDAGRG